MGTILLAVIGQTLFATIAGFWAAAMKRRWWVWVLVSLLLTPIVAYIGLIIVFFISGQPRRIAHATKQGAQSIYDSSKERLSEARLMDDSDRELYTKAGSEVASKSYDPGLFAKAFSEADGDISKAQAIYIRYRVAELRQQRKKAEAEEEAEKQRQDRQGVDARDKDGRTPLMLAAMAGDPDVVKVLVAKGADVNAKDPDCWTSLMWAAYCGELDVVKFLIDKGVDVNARDKDDRTPLMWAVHYRHPDVIKFLVAAGADVNARDKDGRTPLTRAAGNQDVVEFLIQHGAKP